MQIKDNSMYKIY